MKTVQIYDKPMCCSTGVCGAQVDPVLPRFAADLEWLKAQGHQVERYNLAQDAVAFTRHPEVLRLMEISGTDCLPLIAVNGQIVSQGEYPSRETLELWTTVTAKSAKSAVKTQCCSGTGCC